MSRVESVAEAGLRLLRGHPYGFLTTVATSGARARPRTRLVQHLSVDGDGTVWIGTSPRSRKAKDVAAAAEVTYAVEDRTDVAYVTVQATARLVADVAQRRARWVDGLEAFFPTGPAGDDFVLIQLWPERIELMDFAHHIHPDPFGLVPAVAERSDGGWVEVAADRTF